MQLPHYFGAVICGMTRCSHFRLETLKFST